MPPCPPPPAVPPCPPPLVVVLLEGPLPLLAATVYPAADDGSVLPVPDPQAVTTRPIATIAAAGVLQLPRLRKQTPQLGQAHSEVLT